MSLFSANNQPLADKMRPNSLEEIIGQEKIIGQTSLLRQALVHEKLPSIIFWGPPGCGKTTLARIIAKQIKANFIAFSASVDHLGEIKKCIQQAKSDKEFGLKTIFFVDEIHRFNRLQQDSFLPFIEDGTIIFIGATTENPSFSINSALLSRVKVIILKSLTIAEIKIILANACKKVNYTIEDQALDLLAQSADGDARIALNNLELIINSFTGLEKNINLKTVSLLGDKKFLRYDKNKEEHYNIISALHKSLRGSDINASLYWLGRMIEGGEDPLYIARRLIRFASEDIGLAEPSALTQAITAYQACLYIGLPECSVNLAQSVAYLASCPKSNELYTAYQKVQKEINQSGSLPVPFHLRNAVTDFLKKINYGKGYKYNPNYPNPIQQTYLPEEIKNKYFFTPKI